MVQSQNWVGWLHGQRERRLMMVTRQAKLTRDVLRNPNLSFAQFLVQAAEREVEQWFQLLFVEKGPGCVMLLVTSDGRMLLQAKAEPGTRFFKKRHVNLAATIQASTATLTGAYGGKPVHRGELWDSVPSLKYELDMDGARFFEQVNLFRILEVDLDEFPPADNERWFTREEVRQALHGGECNSLLAAMLAFYAF